jgi:hypothetical protein
MYKWIEIFSSAELITKNRVSSLSDWILRLYVRHCAFLEEPRHSLRLQTVSFHHLALSV